MSVCAWVLILVSIWCDCVNIPSQLWTIMYHTLRITIPTLYSHSHSIHAHAWAHTHTLTQICVRVLLVLKLPRSCPDEGNKFCPNVDDIHETRVFNLTEPHQMFVPIIQILPLIPAILLQKSNYCNCYWIKLFLLQSLLCYFNSYYKN